MIFYQKQLSKDVLRKRSSETFWEAAGKQLSSSQEFSLCKVLGCRTWNFDKFFTTAFLCNISERMVLLYIMNILKICAWKLKQPSQGILQKAVLRDYATFIGKHLCRSLFLIINKVRGTRPAILLKRDTGFEVSCEVCKVFSEDLCYICGWLVLWKV